MKKLANVLTALVEPVEPLLKDSNISFFFAISDVSGLSMSTNMNEEEMVDVLKVLADTMNAEQEQADGKATYN